MKLLVSSVLLVAMLMVSVSADTYMHNPYGSNDRNRERSDNRNNGNLLFDSQNNAQGGYPWRGDPTVRAKADPLTYYVGSSLMIEWTNQHACGPNPNNYCTVILQYSTDDGTGPANVKNLMPGIRDGYPDTASLVESDTNNAGYKRLEFSTQTCPNGNAQNQDGTNTIPDNCFTTDPQKRVDFYYAGGSGGVQFAMHEGIDYYQECKTTTRNKGLYAADQNIGPNDARGTRQNPNGGRRGLECPEERDYYPYWRYTPWSDMAVLTSRASLCKYYTDNSQNVKSVEFCNCGQNLRNGSTTTRCTLGGNNNVIPITKDACANVGGRWETDARTVKNLKAPDCQFHAFGRDNHLGNALAVDANGQLLVDPSGEPVTAHYNFQIPSEMAGKNVVIRLRYNISTEDYPATNDALGVDFFDSGNNCPGGAAAGNSDNVDDNVIVGDNSNCINSPKLNVNNRPLYNRPYVNVFGATSPKLSIALNTHQSARTFQDRSYLLRVENPPDYVSGSDIINLNSRGRRGNIVQAYPSVEYDFVPPRINVQKGKWLHIQFIGSDFNAAKNANNGEGWQFSDRINMVQTDEGGVNFPAPLARMTFFNVDTAKKWALLEQDPARCTEYKAGDNNEQNSITNCGKLNRAPNKYPSDPEKGLMQVNAEPGTYYFVSTRNNNFSNRSQKMTINVTPGSDTSTATTVAAVFGSVAGVAVVLGGVLFYGKKNPNTGPGQFYNKVSSCTTKKSSVPASTAPDTVYQRH